MTRLRSLGPELWCAEDDLVMALGVRFPVRMVVFRDAEGGLALWSPIAIDDALADELRDLGAVRWLIAPNLLHHLFLEGAVARYPEAALVGVEGLRDKRPDLPWTHLLRDRLPFASDASVVPIAGAPSVGEVALHHAPSASVIVTDLVFAVRHPKTFWDRVVFGWIAGTLGDVGQSRIWRWVFTRDRAAAGASVRRLLELPFDRLVMAHGEIVETGGPAALERACAWMLEAAPALLPSPSS